MISGIDAITFDIDGTLYPNWSFYRRLGPFLVRNARFISVFGKVREEIRAWQEAHPGERHERFLDWQAVLAAAHLHCSIADARARLDRLVYEGWKPLFRRVKPFSYTIEAFTAFRKAGLKIGILSDFLPSQKGDIWGLAELSDVIIGSEETGALKPSSIPFLALADALSVRPERILYVGNSVRSDVRGAREAGMKVACIISPIADFFGRKVPGADISFSSYRKLTRIVLK